MRGGFECLGYDHHRRSTAGAPGLDQAQPSTPDSSVASPGSTVPQVGPGTAADLGDPFPATMMNTGLPAAAAGQPSNPTQPPVMNLQSGFSDLNSNAGNLHSPSGTGLSGLQTFLDSLGPTQPSDLDGLMPSANLEGDLFGGFGNLLGMGMPSLSNFGQPAPYAHIESTDGEPGLGTSGAPSDAAFNELGAELIASHQTVARPHEGLLLADDEEDDIDPEGLLAEVERSMRSIKLDNGEHISELYDFCEFLASLAIYQKYLYAARSHVLLSVGV